MNYVVHVKSPFLKISPAVKNPLPISFDPDYEESFDEALLVSRHGEVEEIRSKKDALRALYDFQQTHEGLNEGDTFTWKGDRAPFARVQGFEVLPVGGM